MRTVLWLLILLPFLALAACSGEPPAGNAQDAVLDQADDNGAADVASDTSEGDTALDTTASCGSCDTGLTCCSGACVDTAGNPNHCGACGASCGPTQTCVGASCVCRASTDDCDGDPNNGCETSLLESNTHCGACANACPAEAPVCVAGECRCGDAVCGTGETCCDVDGRFVCVDTAASAAHCGACGHDCAVGETCTTGVCSCGGGAACEAGEFCCGDSCMAIGQACLCGVASCGAGETCCDAACAALGSDQQHCGACGNACGGEQECVSGVCACPAGMARCGTACADIFADPGNCGGCGQACAAGESCCDGLCVNTALDLQSCGGCGLACATFCQNGRCQCGGIGPSDLTSDPQNCGACGRSCRNFPNTKDGFCNDAACTILCRDNFADCDGNLQNGCETDIRADSNCGGCGQNCPAGAVCDIRRCECNGMPCDPWSPNAIDAACDPTAPRMCRLTCALGFGDCDIRPETGCETNTSNNPVHCGTCGNVCPAGTACVGGTCG